jgi:fermentation-respiration switch protein FrsA (DUF1100 family)
VAGRPLAHRPSQAAAQVHRKNQGILGRHHPGSGGPEVNAKWFREFLAYDPEPDLAAVRAPVLAITGEKEIQVDPADLARMAELVPGDFESHLVPGLTHLLRAEADEPGLKTYKQQVQRPVDDRVITYVLTWLKEQTGGHHQQA